MNGINKSLATAVVVSDSTVSQTAMAAFRKTFSARNCPLYVRQSIESGAGGSEFDSGIWSVMKLWANFLSYRR
jgi:hypothetical protein